METKGKNQSFFMRNIYYFILGFILVAAIAVTVVLVLTDNGGMINTVEDSGNIAEKPRDDSSNIDKPNEDKPSGGDEKPDEPVDKPDDPDTKPTVKISFVMPVENATILTDYTATSVVFNKTLNVYTGHLAIDFAAEAGTAVKAVFDGVVESVETSYLTGTTVTIKHNDNLKTVYNSIEVDEKLTAGATIKQGDVIGTVSDNNKQEYKDGAHLHFEVYENGKKISPYKYLAITEK